MDTIYDFSVRQTNGNQVSLREYANQVMLIVNTATECGFTPQYDGLEALYRKYQDQGFVVLDFPCNQFGNQAPGSDEEIAGFCALNFDTTFPRFAKVVVRGEGADPLFQYLAKQAPGLMGERIKWNFTKFLVDRSGKVVKRFSPTTTPKQLERPIEALL